MVRRIDEAAEKNRGNEAVGLACSNRGGYLNLDQTRAFFRAAIEPHVLRCVGRGMQRTLV